jgi:hypothetical protein
MGEVLVVVASVGLRVPEKCKKKLENWQKCLGA